MEELEPELVGLILDLLTDDPIDRVVNEPVCRAVCHQWNLHLRTGERPRLDPHLCFLSGPTMAWAKSLPVLQWARANGCPWGASTCAAAAKAGRLDVLQWARTNGCRWDQWTCAFAAEYGRLDVLQWARANGCPWDQWTCAFAAQGGHLDVLQWARANGCPWDQWTCSDAAQGGHLDVVQWARANGCLWDKVTCSDAAKGGHLDVLQWARANGCPWTEHTCAMAAEGGHLDVLQWAHANGCPLGQGMIIDIAAKGGHLDILQWARAIGCPWSEWTSAIVAESGRLDVLQWAHANGCPLDESACAAAAEGGHHDALEWIRAHMDKEDKDSDMEDKDQNEEVSKAAMGRASTAVALFVALAVAFASFGGGQAVQAADNIALQWYELQDRVLFAPLGSGPVRGPNRATAVGQSRAIFLLTSAVYDAWAVYDSKAIPSTYRYAQSKVPRMHGGSADVHKAISYAAYRLFEFLHAEEPLVLEAATEKLQALGYDPAVNETNTKTPAGVGNLLAARIVDAAKVDGTNSEGDHPGSIHPDVPYADYSNYQPINEPKTLEEIKNEPCKGINSLDHWTPLKAVDGTVQEFNVPYMPFVTPFALDSATEVVMAGPPMPNTPREDEFRQQFFDLFAYSANLTDLQKVDAEFWAYASGAELFYKITFDSARNLNLSLPDTVKLLFAQGVAVWDAAVSCWTYKRVYTSGRPTTVIPCLFANTTAEAWMGPYRGRGLINGSHWQPYIDTPPFSEYPSGHSTFTAASAVVLQRFLKSDVYHGNPVVVLEGSSYREPRITNTSDPGYVAGLTDVPNTGPGTPGYVPATNITLTWKTYSEAAVAAGVSRIHAGFHIKSGNEDALAAGSAIGEKVWVVCSALWDPPASNNRGGDNDSDDGVGGKIAGAVIGSVLGTLLISAIVVAAAYYLAKRKARRGYSSDYVAYSS